MRSSTARLIATNPDLPLDDVSSSSERPNADDIHVTVGAIQIAVVDDDPRIRASLERLIKAEGFAVQLFASAEEFLQWGQREAITCLVLDHRLPGITGLELQKHLNASNGQMKIIFISGREDMSVRTEAMECGAIEFLAKPFRSEALIGAIRSTLQGSPTLGLRETIHGSTCHQEWTRENT